MCEDGKSSSSGSSSSKCASAVSVLARIAGMGLAVASAALMATASQCTVYAAYGARPRTVTYSDYPSFVFLVVANAMAAFLGAITVFLSVWKKGKDKKARVLMPLLGAVVPALLYSSTGAALAAGSDMTYCSAYGKRVSVCAGGAGVGLAAGSNFCQQARLAVFLSLAAAIAVSVADFVRSVPLSMSFGGGGDSDSDSSSDSGGACDRGCHAKH